MNAEGRPADDGVPGTAEAIASTIERDLEDLSDGGRFDHRVAQWWLGDAHRSAIPGQIEQALDLLVGRGRLRRVGLVDGTALYASATAVGR